MKHIINSLKYELTLIMRNGISLFMVFAPAFLALVFILIFGAVRSSSVKIAVDQSLSKSDIEKIERIADVEFYTSLEELTTRVERTDTILGVYKKDGVLTLLSDGSEGDAYTASIQALIGLTLARETLDIHEYALEAKNNEAYTISMISVLLLSLFVGSATLGFSLVGEREHSIIKAWVISPSSFGLYVLGKLIPSFILCFAGLTIALLIMNLASFIPLFALLSLCSIFVYGFMIFTLGSFANSQVGAIGVIKLLMPLSMMLPISSIFVPDSLVFLYTVFPQYWQYKAIDEILRGVPMWRSAVMTLLVSIPWFSAVLVLFSKKTQYRVWR